VQHRELLGDLLADALEAGEIEAFGEEVGGLPVQSAHHGRCVAVGADLERVVTVEFGEIGEPIEVARELDVGHVPSTRPPSVSVATLMPWSASSARNSPSLTMVIPRSCAFVSFEPPPSPATNRVVFEL